MSHYSCLPKYSHSPTLYISHANDFWSVLTRVVLSGQNRLFIFTYRIIPYRPDSKMENFAIFNVPYSRSLSVLRNRTINIAPPNFAIMICNWDTQRCIKPSCRCLTPSLISHERQERMIAPIDYNLRGHCISLATSRLTQHDSLVLLCRI